jgi:hypothetical protein
LPARNLARWFQKSNLIWSLNFDDHNFNKLKCLTSDCSDRNDSSAVTAHRRLGIDQKGGHYKELIFAHHWLF